jgi:hypothetical protein
MATYLGIKKLTAEESALVDEIKGASLFSGYASECSLESSLKRKHKEAETALVEPYADFLLQHIKSRCESNRDALWCQLRGEGQCDVFDYLTVFYNQTLLEKKRALAEIPHEDRGDYDFRPPHVLDATFGIAAWTEHDDGQWYTTVSHDAIRMHRIFSNSDILQRIALLFGPKFKAVRESSTVEEREGQWGWKHTLVSIRVKYLGDQMGSHEVDAMLKTYAMQRLREPFTLTDKQWVFGTCMPWSPVPRPVSLLGASSDYVHVPAHLSGTGREERVVAMRF